MSHRSSARHQQDQAFDAPTPRDGMFGAVRRSRRTASAPDDSGSSNDVTWASLRQSAPELLSVADAAAALQLEPAAFAGLSLADLSMLLPDVQPAQLLSFRLAIATPMAPTPMPKNRKGVTRPPGMAASGFFFGNLLSHGPSGISNDRLALWFEVTLVMSTLLFSLALSLTVAPPVTCANPDDAADCATLLVADQIVWSCTSFLLWAGGFLTWGSFLVILVCSVDDAKHLFSNNIRVCSWGVLITILGLFLFGPGIALRVWIVSVSRASQYVAVGVMGAGIIGIQVAIVILMGATGIDTWREFFVAFLGGFGLLPGTNRLAIAGSS